MGIPEKVQERIVECQRESADYLRWLAKLRLPNALLIGLGSLLAFLGGAALLADVFESRLAGTLALVGGALTGFHSWFGCEAHQAECRKLAGQFESLQSRYETLTAAPDASHFRELELELATVKEGRKARPRTGLLDFGRKR